MSSSTDHGRTTSGPLGRPVVRGMLVAWIAVVIFFFSLQQGLYKFSGEGALRQHLKDLNAWVCRFTSPKTTTEPER